MKTIIGILLILAVSSGGVRAVQFSLPSANQGSWEPGVDVGVTGGISQYRPGGSSERTNLIDVTHPPYSADNTGTVDVSGAIDAAIAAASPGDVVWFPEGIYLLENLVRLSEANSDITLRGQGDNSVIKMNSGGQIVLSGGAPFYRPDVFEIVTGNKTKGTRILEVADTSDFEIGDFWQVQIEDETDSERIAAGEPPTWTVLDKGFARRMTVVITAIDPGEAVAIDPPLPIDCTNYTTRLATRAALNNRAIQKVGIENLKFVPVPGDHYKQCIQLTGARDCWVSGCSFAYTNTTSSGQAVRMFESYRTEIRKNTFTISQGGNGDGAVNYFRNSCVLIENNVLTGPWNVGFYSSSGNVNSAILFNFIDGIGKGVFVGHGEAYDTLLLVEGNVSARLQADSFWGASHYNTVFRNWLHGCESDGTPSDGGVGIDFTLALNRFTRNYALVGNVYGWDGLRSAETRYGEPNIGNNNYTGYAGPTGSSTDPNSSSADFWRAWGVGGSLTSRTSDDLIVITVDDSSMFSVGMIKGTTLYWDNKTKYRKFLEVTNIIGNQITLETQSATSGDILPAESTVFSAIEPGPGAWQELDLDVEPSIEIIHNYASSAGGLGAITDSTTDTLPESLAYSSKPDWWNNDGYSGEWPPIDPSNPGFNMRAIPAGERALQIPGAGMVPGAPKGLKIVLPE